MNTDCQNTLTLAITWKCSNGTYKDETIDLIYPDPHFSSNATYNDLVGQMRSH